MYFSNISTTWQVKIVSGGEGRFRAELVIEPEHQNKFGTLHGGLTATLVDSLSTAALISHKVGVPGVTVDLHIMYLKAAAIGETVVIDCNTLKAGRTLAFLTVDITKKETGELVARGSHTKFIGS
ncbi:acyl-coenzyme A thioesterase 13-like isoform X2 [Zootermopsis nevadensis]|uniref:acyl-coenzyme A thioesterase 13-like isoform X2 n=1 Tax=Zootermopsis nevadensis TaxID=136037 RepID=UPI000B8E4831|nr:acyl-coenzyme A thioesterase 13-like isoform X2 [Zootermopsis nevadensis]